MRGVEVVDNWLQQLLTRRMDPLQIRHQFRPPQVCRLLEQQLSVAHNVVDGRTQLVAEIV
jgi:hypothetical protein